MNGRCSPRAGTRLCLHPTARRRMKSTKRLLEVILANEEEHAEDLASLLKE